MPEDYGPLHPGHEFTWGRGAHWQGRMSPGMVPSAPAGGPLPGLGGFLARVHSSGLCSSAAAWDQFSGGVMPAALISDWELCSSQGCCPLSSASLPMAWNGWAVSQGNHTARLVCVPSCRGHCPVWPGGLCFLSVFSCFGQQEGKCLVLHPGQSRISLCLGLQKLGCISEYIPLSYPWVLGNWRK